MAEDAIEDLSYQLLVQGMKLFVGFFNILLPVLTGLYVAALVVCRSVYHTAYLLSFRHAPSAKKSLPHQPYEYTRLPGERYIRILQLKNTGAWSQGDHVIECDLLAVSLDKPVLSFSYRAISYTWDGQDRDRYILCSGKKLAITKNCEDVLRHMLQHARFFIWIDAICIDQTCSEEKSTQIPLMTQIYGRAYVVNVWLGPPAEGTRLVFSYVWLFWCCVTFPEPLRTWLERKLHGIIEARDHTPYFLEVLRRNWWRRVWTIQESAFAPDARQFRPCPLLVNCGQYEIPMDCLSAALFKFYRCHYMYEDNIYIHNYTVWAHYLLSHFSFRVYTKSNPMVPLDIVMFRNRACDATDRKDRVYGLYGILQEFGIKLSKPSYLKTLDEVYLDFTREACQATQSLCLLNLVAGSKIGLKAPSWVPDYSGPFRSGDVWVRGRASLDSVPSFWFSGDGRILTSAGFFVGSIKVKSTCTIWQPSSDPILNQDGDFVNLEEGYQETVQAFRDWYVVLKEHAELFGRVYGDYDGLMRAFGQVLTVGWASESPYMVSAWTYLLNKEQDRSQDLAIVQQNPKLRAHFHDDENRRALTESEEWQTLCALKMSPKTARLNHTIWMHTADKSFFVTDEGFMGTAHSSIKEGDVIALLSSVDRPMVLRQGQSLGTWILVGPAYIQGMMEGELWDSSKLQSICII